MEWIDTIVKIVFLVLGTLVTVYVVPWLKEKGLYDIVKKMVQGAEKWSETMDIDKKEWVIERLEARGIEVNDYVEALIESACEELDIAWANVSSEFTEE
jgi:hypothetical protein